MKYKSLIIFLLAIVLIFNGCASFDKKTMIVLGVITGGLIGAAIGDSKGAITGIALGAVAGHLYNEHIANKRESFPSDKEYLEACKESARNISEETMNYYASLEIDLSVLKPENSVHKRIFQVRLDESLQKLARAQDELLIQLQVLKNNRDSKYRNQATSLKSTLSKLESHISRLQSKIVVLEEVVSSDIKLDSNVGKSISEYPFLDKAEKDSDRVTNEYDELQCQFPWPSPKASTSAIVPSEFFMNKGEKTITLDEINTKLKKALDHAGYVDKSYYAVRDDGFAIVTRLEQINSDGTSKEGVERWSTIIAPSFISSFKEYVKNLLEARVGYYRIIVFIVSPYPVEQSDKTMTSKEADTLLTEGAKVERIPGPMGRIKYTRNYNCVALVYEFERSENIKETIFRRHSRLTAKTHLINANIWNVLVRSGL